MLRKGISSDGANARGISDASIGAMLPVCLAIGGSDPSAGAGIQADLKTFQRHGVYGTAAISLLTVQDTTGVKDVRVLDAEFLAAQLRPAIRL